MRSQLLAFSVLLAASAAPAFAQPQPPQPGAEQKNLAAFAGTWKMEAKMEASPFGPAGMMTGTETCRMFEGGWHLVCESSGNGPFGAVKGHALMTYDRSTKQYRYFAINNMPDAEMATGTRSGNVWTWTSQMDTGGKTMHSRFLITEESPSSHTYKWETSEDGKNWKTIMTGKSTKTT